MISLNNNFDHCENVTNIVSPQDKKRQSSEESDDDIPDALRPDLLRQDSKDLQYAWEQKIVDETLMKNSTIDKAAIVGLDGALKAWSPPDFIPDNQVIQVGLELGLRVLFAFSR